MDLCFEDDISLLIKELNTILEIDSIPRIVSYNEFEKSENIEKEIKIYSVFKFREILYKFGEWKEKW